MSDRPPIYRILIIGRSEVTDELSTILKKQGSHLIDQVVSPVEAFESYAYNPYQMVFVDDLTSEPSTPAVLQKFKSKRPHIPLMALSHSCSVENVVGLVRHGAFDVLEIPLKEERVADVMAKIFEHHPQLSTLRTAFPPLGEADMYYGMVGRSQAMKSMFHLIERIHDSSVNILITGPSGSGKEKIASALHKTSPRAGQKFVAINCSAIPYSLLEGELFGYKKGAFTDARADKVGLFQEAQGGTLFLDEIGDMPLAIQPKILRAIQEKEIRPLGAIKSVQVDVRIIAATNQDLGAKINEKLFREDLYYRLNAMQIEVPPLKDRAEDIPLLAEYFLDRFCEVHHHPIKSFEPQAMMALTDYPWPGNVRELENVVERATLLVGGDTITAMDLPLKDNQAVSPSSLPTQEWARQCRPLEEVEKEYILEVLQSVNGNRSETAHILKIGRKTLYNKLAKYGI